MQTKREKAQARTDSPARGGSTGGTDGGANTVRGEKRPTEPAAPPLFSEAPGLPRSEFVSMALLVLQGKTMPATGDLPEQRFEHSPHRHIPEDVIVNAAARPSDKVELSDSTAKAPSWLQQPLDVFTTAAGTALEILNKWLHYANRGRALDEFEAKVARAQARALAAAEILLREIGPRVSRYLPPLDRPVCVAEVEAPTWHAWCAEAARAVLRRAFPPHFVYGTGTGTALFDPSQSMPEVRAGWLGEINQSALRRVSNGTLFEYSGAWKRFVDGEANAARSKTENTGSRGRSWPNDTKRQKRAKALHVIDKAEQEGNHLRNLNGVVAAIRSTFNDATGFSDGRPLRGCNKDYEKRRGLGYVLRPGDPKALPLVGRAFLASIDFRGQLKQ